MKKRKPLTQNLSFRVDYDCDHFILQTRLNAEYQNYLVQEGEKGVK